MNFHSTTSLFGTALPFRGSSPVPAKRLLLLGLAPFILSVSAALLCAGQKPSAANYGNKEIVDQDAYLYYAHIKTIINEPLAKVEHHYSSLKHLEPAQSQADLPVILQKAGQNVELLFKNLPNTACREIIRETRLNNDRTVDKSLVQEFNYIILTGVANGLDEFREYRTNSKGHLIDLSRLQGASVTTIGFASMPLVFLPRYQPESRFRFLGHDQIKHQEVDVVAYAQIFSKSQEMGYVDIGGKEALILTQGMAWIDPHTFQILRLRTDLLAPRPDIVLDRQMTDIEFGRVKFKNSPAVLWLPRQVTVEVVWNGVTFQNTHTYSRFRLFNVQTDQAITPPSNPKR